MTCVDCKDSPYPWNCECRPAPPKGLDATLWWCENCQMKGRVEFASDAGVWEVFQMLGDLHRTAAPDCAETHGTDGVRVVPAGQEQKP